MNDEAKRFILDSLRKTFGEFMQEVIKIPGSIQHKQQAFFRFEEAHMWLQNAIVSYVAPQAQAPQAKPEVVADLTKEQLDQALANAQSIEAPQADTQPITE